VAAPALHVTRWAGVLASVLVACACAPSRLVLPSGPGGEFDQFADALAEAAAACRQVRSLTAELSISGRAAGARLRGRVLAGFADPAALRLEAVAPFGPPIFILVSWDGRATLLLEREGRVLADAIPEELLEVVAGIPLGPDDLRAALAGCVSAETEPLAGRVYANGWVRVTLPRDTSVFLRRDAAGWRIAAGIVRGLTVEYPQEDRGLPREVRLRAGPGPAGETDLRVRVLNPEINVALGPRAFTVRVPAGAEPLTLDDLRQGGPLGGKRE